MTRCSYTVRYDDENGNPATAKFSDGLDAIDFARQKSGEVSRTAGSGKGLIGQFVNGKATAEFAHLDAIPA